MALLGNARPHSKAISLDDGVLRTNGGLVSMKAPPGWTASMTIRKIYPGAPQETFFFLSKGGGSKTSIGLFFSGIYFDEVDGRLQKEELFDSDIDLVAGSAEATKLIGGDGMLAEVSWMGKYLLSVDHAVQSYEKYCRAIKSTTFKGLKSVIFEFENVDLGRKTIEYCIDVLGNGRILYSLFYTSSREFYAENLDTAVSALETSVWTTEFDPSLELNVVS
ncbi:MAG: hypothetical protein KC777_17235 [Cyanobacteria bacterium HKST-UBA02]|nr:hypothetical protein [Cyanobacteria bacterium HKST-UBA02]